ncbi:alpha/beta-hydrolase [Violaceomyces palustris]|uniref:Alpha/beta-hydrolase n=1 Tax=Violaceomyces palustris TaxID=1673888 RepID=A0ACD0NSA9_9BASI|nr:alpha/beta-hydrolase [Violaceomyces palustris]
MRFSNLLLALLPLSSSALAAQLPFRASNQYEHEEHHRLSSASFKTLRHPALPAHSLRVTTPPAEICERNVGAKSFAGYLDVDLDKLRSHRQFHGSQSIHELQDEDHSHSLQDQGVVEHFYFWAFESRNDPLNDPVVLWLNGGPGCSSFTGLLMELGPCNARQPDSHGPGTEWNPWAWNNNATMIFLDQPVGTGLSYVSWSNTSRTDKPPSRIFSTPAAARDASAFLHLLALHAGREILGFDESQPEAHHGALTTKKLKNIPSFHMSGESYAGRYLPLIASQILRDNEQAKAHPERGLEPLPLASVLIGNGITSPKDQFPAYVDYACTNASGRGEPFFSKAQCDKMYAQVPVCLTLVEKCNARLPPDQRYDSLACQTASTYCEGALSSPWDKLNVSYYDWKHGPEYEEEAWVAAFLNDVNIRSDLGVDRFGPGDKHDGVFEGCSDAVYRNFEKTGDGARDSTWAVEDILSKGVRVLSYSGRRDFICNYVGNRRWVEGLDWQGSKEFKKLELKPWYIQTGDDSEPRLAGEFKNHEGLTYAIVDEAGHFVPHDQPAAALTMFNRWLHQPGDGRL